MLTLPVTVKCIKRNQIAYVDDTNFYSNGNQCESLIQEIINKYVNLYEATGAKIQEEKVKFYCWKYYMIQGERKCQQIKKTIVVHNKEVEQIDANESVRTLGAHINPMLKWNTQFEKLKEKVIIAIGKLNNTSLQYQEAAIFS